MDDSRKPNDPAVDPLEEVSGVGPGAESAGPRTDVRAEASSAGGDVADVSWESVLARAMEAGASDVVCATGQTPLCQIQGYWLPVADSGPVEAGRLRQWVESMAGDEGRKALDERGEAMFVRGWSDGSRRLRGIARGEAKGLSLAVRFIPSEAPAPAVLEAPPMLESLLAEPGGLILIGGGAASGRSTLLAAAVEQINESSTRRVAYLGVPPEFAFTRKQSTILRFDLRVGREDREGGGGFQSCLEALRFHDVDVVAIDSILRGDDLLAALLAGQSGVLMLLVENGQSTKHLLRGLVERLPESRRRLAQNILAESLRAVVIQTLVKRSDGQGRLAVHEILLQTRALADPLREGRWDALSKILSTSRQHGMRALDDSLDEYLQKGLIAGEEAYRHALDKTRFLRFGPAEWQSAGTP